MAQFDVYRNPGQRTGRTHPFLVVVQSDRWSASASRLVAPLVLRSVVPVVEVVQHLLTPLFTIQRRDVFLNPFDLTPVPVGRLGRPVASFADDAEAKRRIQRALDEVLSTY